MMGRNGVEIAIYSLTGPSDWLGQLGRCCEIWSLESQGARVPMVSSSLDGKSRQESLLPEIPADTPIAVYW